MPEWKKTHDDGGVAAPPPKPLASWYAPGLSDGLGDRLLMFDNSTAPSLELLRFRPELAQAPGFESALRERVQRLARFTHPAFARVRSVQRLEPDDDLALISNCTPGKRLSEVLHRAGGPAFAATLIRQLGPALALLQQHDDGMSHGVLNPDRIVVSPDGRLTIVEHVVGPAIGMLNLGSAHLASMGIALPPAAGEQGAQLDVATDWYQLGLVAMSVLLGRQVTASDLPRLETLLDERGHSAGRDGMVLSPWIRQWLQRALQISGPRIESGGEGRAAVDELLQRERSGEWRRIEPEPQSPVASPPESVPLEAQPSRSSEAGTWLEAVPLTYFPLETQEIRPAGATVHQPAAHVPSQVVTNARAITYDSPAATPGPRHLPVAPRPQPVVAPRPQAPVAPRPQPPAALRPQPLEAPRPQPRPDPRTPTSARRTVSTSVVVMLALVAVAEAGIITWLARALWLTPRPPIVVETTAYGENVLTSGASSAAPPIQLTVAPDLSWTRIVSPSSTAVAPAGKAAGSVPGILSIFSPIELDVFERSRRLGSTQGAGLRLAAGRHDIELVNEVLGYRLSQVVEIKAGYTVSIHVVPPPGQVTIDASPWAEVSIDGKSAGRTPLGPLALAPGAHVVKFLHPAGGADEQRVTVKSGAKIRVVGKLRP